jgi:hypothetical protein
MGNDMIAKFETSYGIRYGDLVAVPQAHKGKYKADRARFFLAFPKANIAELRLLKAYLREHTLPNLILTNLDERGFESFLAVLPKSDSIGVIMVRLV